MRPLAYVLLLFPAAVLGASFPKDDVKTIFDSAEVVARVLILGTETIYGHLDEREVSCGTRVRAKVIESLKGTVELVEFHSVWSRHVLSKEYLVFLWESDTRHRLVTEKTDALGRPVVEQTRACDGLQPRLTSSPYTESQFVSKWSPEKGAVETWVVAASHIDVPEDPSLEYEIFEVKSVLVNGKLIDNAAEKIMGSQFAVPDNRFAYVESFEWESYKAFIKDAVVPR